MTIKQIYNLAIKLGIKNDLRGEKVVRQKLKREKEKFNSLKEEEKKEFDLEKLFNPFSDTRLFSKEPNKKVKRVLVGIDIEVAELLLARELSRQGKEIDLIISHHPIGPALAGLHEVMEMQAEVLAGYGIPINIAQNLLHLRIDEVARRMNPINHNRVIDAANILGFSLMCIHTASDNLVANYLKKLIDRNQKKLILVKDVLKLLKSIPEYQIAIKQKTGPRLFAGKEENYTGKIALTEITGGTEGNPQIYEKFALAGIGTIIGMHVSEEHKKAAEKAHLNVIIAGHMSSDSLGMNLFLDELEKRGIQVIPCSGLIRVRRFKKKIKKRK